MEEYTMNNYTIRVSQLNDSNEYEYIGNMFIESNITFKELKDDFDTCLELFEKIIQLLEQQQRMTLLADGEYNFTDDSIECFGVIMEQNDNVHCLQLQLVQES